MDAASALTADRLSASLAGRVWSFGQATREGCNILLLVHGSLILSRPRLDDTEIAAPVLLWLPHPVRGTVQVRAGSQGYTAFVSDNFVHRTASDPLLAAHRQAFLGEFTLVGAELLAPKLACLVASFEALVEESREMSAGAATALGLHLGVLILHLWRCAGIDRRQGRSGQTTVQRFTRLVELHYREGLRMTDYADRLGVSHAQLHESCLRAAGRTPLALVHERLLEEAHTRLRQNELSVEQVGYSLGFRDPGYFNRFFKRLTGEAPGAFQRSHGVKKRATAASFAAWP